MSLKNRHFTSGLRTLARALASSAMLAAALLTAIPMPAAFHFWNIREVYTDASGTNQFIEFFTSSSGQQSVSGQRIMVSSGGTNHTFTIQGNLPVSPTTNTANRAFIIATASVTNFGAPKPDYVISNNFIFPGGAAFHFSARTAVLTQRCPRMAYSREPGRVVPTP